MTFIQHLHLINMEQLLHYVWKHKLFALKPQQTTDGKAVEIIDSVMGRECGDTPTSFRLVQA